MNKWILICFFAVLSCHLGYGLECYKCDYGGCSFPSKTTCGALEVCLTQTAKSGDLYLKKKSCGSPTQCTEVSEDTYMGIKVKTTPECCMQNLCNSAVKTSASVATAIALLVSLWAAKVL